MMLIYQLVDVMDTAFWCTNFFQIMLGTEVIWSSTRPRSASQDKFHLSQATKMICFFNPVISYGTRSHKTFKTSSKHISALVFELLAILCPKFGLHVTNQSVIFGWF